MRNGNSREGQMPNLGISMQVDSEGNVQGSSFSMESTLFNNDNQQTGGGGFAIPYQSLAKYQQGYQVGSSSCDEGSQQSVLPSRKIGLLKLEGDLQDMRSARKRPFQDIHDLLPQKGIDIGTALNMLTFSNKKVKVNYSEQQWQHQLKQATEKTQDHRVRRSQKLSDKVTALQKLVSPYGKTDTASVLKEASLYIKLRQEQIQNLFHMLSSSYNNARTLHSQETREKQPGLRNKGLCLVPISLSKKVTKDDLFHIPHAISRKITSIKTHI